jgi:PAS domain S-box-containing protein
MDKDLRYTYWNKASEKLTRILAKDAIGKSLTAVFPNVNGTRVEQFYQEVLRTKQSQSFLNKYKIGDKDFVFEIIAYPTMAGLSVFAKDISERKKMEEVLRESEEKYRTQFEEALDAIFLAEVETGIIIDCNRAASKLVDREKSELVGEYQRILHPSEEIKGEFSMTYKQHIKEKEGQVLETRVITKKGEIRDVSIKANIFELGDKKVLQGIFRDITEQKQVQQALADSEEKFHAISASAMDAIILVDDTGKISYWNPAAERIFGYAKEEAVGQDMEKLLMPPQHHGFHSKSAIHSLEDVGQIYGRTIEFKALRKDGTKVPIELSVSTLKLKDRTCLLGIVRDVSERKKMEKQLKEYSEHLEEKVEERTNQLKEAQEQLLKAERLAAIGEAAAMVGHDLRNPLQVITNTLYLSEKKSKFISITDKEILEKHGFLELRSGLKEQAEYMDKIVSDLQDYARPLKPKLVEIGLHELIDKTLSSLTVPENVKVSIAIEKDFPKLTLDPTLMQRVFSNLITNAVQAMPDGGKLTIRASKKEETTLISIEDTGEGISDENLSKLFTPLFTTKAKGQGFGLPVCKRMVEAHDGNITVESKVGKGSTFTIKIPLRKEVSYK